MLSNSRDPEIEQLFEPLREAVEQTASWRYSQISHWVPAIYFGLKGDSVSAERATEWQNAALLIEDWQRTRIALYKRFSKDLRNLLGENYGEIVNDFLQTVSPDLPDHKYSHLVDAAMAYALLSDQASSTDLLSRARQVRDSLSQLEIAGSAESIIIEGICLGANGLWPQARRVVRLVSTLSSTYAPIQIALERFVQGPPFSGLHDALKLCEGRPYIGLAAIMLRRVSERFSSPNTRIHLTAAELAVLRLLVLGKSNKEIADARNRSAETVKRQVATLYRKLGVENRTSALAVARERGLL